MTLFGEALKPDFESESWEKTEPDNTPAYIVFGLFALGCLGAFSHEPNATTFVVIGLFANAVFYWVYRNTTCERRYESDRVIVEDDCLRLSRRYTVEEHIASEIDVYEIEMIILHAEEDSMLEIVATDNTEMLILPSPARAVELVEVLTDLNPRIEVSK